MLGFTLTESPLLTVGTRVAAPIIMAAPPPPTIKLVTTPPLAPARVAYGAPVPGEGTPATTVIGPTSPDAGHDVAVSADASGNVTVPPPPSPPVKKPVPWLALGAGAAVIAVVGGAAVFLTRKKQGVSGFGRRIGRR